MIVNSTIVSHMAQELRRNSILRPETLRTSGALLAAHIALSRLIDDEAVAPTGADPTALDLLTRLDQTPGNQMRAVELSRQLLLSPSHVSRTIDKVEAAGLVVRSHDPTDRRASQVGLTDAGRLVLEDFSPRLEGIIDRVITRVLTEDENQTLIELLRKVEKAACSPRDESREDK